MQTALEASQKINPHKTNSENREKSTEKWWIWTFKKKKSVFIFSISLKSKVHKLTLTALKIYCTKSFYFVKKKIANPQHPQVWKVLT